MHSGATTTKARVALLAGQPGRIAPGSVCDEPAMNIDIFPTSLRLAGPGVPEDRVIDGRDIGALLVQRGSKSPHESLYFYHHGDPEGVRAGKWKSFRGLNDYVWPLPANEKLGWLSRHTKGPLPLLFNLAIDPGEAYSVATLHPEVVRCLDARMARWEWEMERNPEGWTETKRSM